MSSEISSVGDFESVVTVSQSPVQCRDEDESLAEVCCSNILHCCNRENLLSMFVYQQLILDQATAIILIPISTNSYFAFYLLETHVVALSP